MPEPARVARPRADAAAAYDRMSEVYDLLAGPYEWPFAQHGLRLLDAQPGERIVEIGPGPGRALVEIARAVGPDGGVVAVDLSPRMHAAATRRLGDLAPRVDLRVGDAIRLALPNASADGVFACFVLDLFDTPDLPVVLATVRRVLKPGGRVCVVAMDLRDPATFATRLYALAHRWMPRLVDCRPIPATALLQDAGFTVETEERYSSWGLPIVVVRARRDTSAT